MHQEKVHQEKIKAVKSRLNFKEVSQHSESGTPSRRRDLRKRLGSRRIRSVSGSPEPSRDRSESPRKRDLERKIVFKRMEKGVFHRLGDKEKSISAYSNDSRRQLYHNSPHAGRKRCQKLKAVQEDIGRQDQKSKGRALRMTIYPNHGYARKLIRSHPASAILISRKGPVCQVTSKRMTELDGRTSFSGNFQICVFLKITSPNENFQLVDEFLKPIIGEVWHNTDECMHLKRQIEELLKNGKLSHVIKELKQNSGKDQPKTNKKGETSNKDKALAILIVQLWQRVARQRVTQKFSPDPEISFPPLEEEEGTKGPMIIEAEIGGHFIYRMFVDGGLASEILYEYCFNRLRPEVKNQMVSATAPLIGFSGKIIWPLGQISLQMKIGDEEHSTLYWMNFVIVRSSSPYIGIIGRPGVRKIQAVPSIAHGMLKFLVARRILTLKSSKIIPIECAAVSGPEGQPPAVNQAIEERIKKPADMTGVPRHIAEHRLNVREVFPSVRQKKRGQAADRNHAIQEEVKKLVDVDFKDLNKACPKDDYLLPEIDWKVESLCGFPFKCFLDAYKGYHQIKMAKEDEEKTTFITSQRIFCYSKMPFGLSNARATYQRLVDKAFHKQIGRNLEVYVDDLVTKSRTEDEIIRDNEETFKTLTEINMKLNPKKCTFGVEEGMFLGYKVNTKGIKVCPDKEDVVLSLSSPKCFKDVQKLDGKLASLNRFLAKSAEKSLPFFKTLKKCTKKSDFHWTEEVESAFKQMKQLIARLPMLTAPEEKEELIVYLAAAKEAVSAVLMTEREAKQMPIYFVSHALRGLEVNYTSMEKLVLALVHANKRLKRYFQAHPIIVVTDQPIKQVPRVSVKGQILADFIVERPEEDSSDTSIEIEEQLPEPWILFEATNNEAEYEALIAGLRIAEQMGVKNLQANVDSRLVAN
ncbi:reverse transcriptase domain-containing protein [Tanacetum coccineum]